MKVTFTLSIGISNAYQEDTFDYDDDVSDKELEEDWQIWSNNYIDGGYEREGD